MTTEFSLVIDGRLHEGWESGSVKRSLETISGTFSIRVSEVAPGITMRRPIRPGQRCELLLNNSRVIAGWVDGIRVSYSASHHEIEVFGRDATGDLVDCSVADKPGEWHNESLEKIVADIAQPFGISVRAEAETGEAFRRFRVEVGETCFEAIERACRFRRLLPLSDGAGGLVIGMPKRTRSEVSLVFGENILTADGEISWVDRFSDYRIKAQQTGSDFFTPEAAAHVQAEASDKNVTRHRPRTIIAEKSSSLADAQARIEWEAVVRAARSRRVSISVQGWEETPGGALWEPGRIVAVADRFLGLDEMLLISSVNQSKSNQGSNTTLELYPEEAFIPRLERQNQAANMTGWWD